MSYPIGTPGTAWGETEKQQWLTAQQIKRSYQQEVVSELQSMPAHFEVIQYGALPYDAARYPLFILKSHPWHAELPTVLVTGGVHGYETSGVHGALAFARLAAGEYLSHFNLLVAPCLSPWGYETINRWNPMAVDPNRSFYPNSPAPEAALLMNTVQALGVSIYAHFDLHETTDTDNSEFRPALAARDGTVHDNWNIPDGFYVVDDSVNPQPAFQAAVIQAVEKVTHIAPADENGEIIGSPLEQKGVINYAKARLGLCGGFSQANYVTTTEVYPDSASATPQNCIDAQVAAIRGGLDYLLNL
ncbi:M14 family metallocarboxypeptidase [Bowmanella sp. JS7-9]|uniref:M14 family metallocarboxypeptidase n=1 Tax=Pseudobowmanella zhangzhouensis TaxID=1537679 RepID=A0ABW1XF94_9ALTE|nr:M14 family metallocarboxypeptidase [Bowmanella sp. JS7-9]TBX21429.1 peptidase [Bowmanella sp. JS7-9]